MEKGKWSGRTNSRMMLRKLREKSYCFMEKYLNATGKLSMRKRVLSIGFSNMA